MDTALEVFIEKLLAASQEAIDSIVATGEDRLEALDYLVAEQAKLFITSAKACGYSDQDILVNVKHLCKTFPEDVFKANLVYCRSNNQPNPA